MPASEPSIQRVLLYDAECGFCTRWCNWARRRGAERMVDFRSCVDEHELRDAASIAEGECAHAAFLVETRLGEVLAKRRAAAAVNGVLIHLPGLRNVGWRTLGRLYQIPGIKQIEEWGYRWIARNRHKLGSASCRLPD